MSLALECQIKANAFFERNKEILFEEAMTVNPHDAEGEFHLMKKQHFENMISERASEAFGKIVDMTNGLSSQELAKYFLIALNRQHNYLQGEFWNTIIHLMKLYSTQDGFHFDVRNENARKMCEEISKQWL